MKMKYLEDGDDIPWNKVVCLFALLDVVEKLGMAGNTYKYSVGEACDYIKRVE